MIQYRKGAYAPTEEKGALFKINPKNLMLLFPEQKIYILE